MRGLGGGRAVVGKNGVDMGATELRAVFWGRIFGMRNE